MGFFLRWLFAFLLLAATFNPSLPSYATWVRANLSAQPAMAALFGLVLLAGYLICLRATLSSIGIVGIVLILGIITALFWVLFSVGLLAFGNPVLNGWIVILALSLMLAVGMHWSIIWRRISGQVDVDEVDTN